MREGADALNNMLGLMYKKNIKSYLNTFQALSLLANATAETLQHVVDEAMPVDILTMRFSQNPGLFRVGDIHMRESSELWEESSSQPEDF